MLNFKKYNRRYFLKMLRKLSGSPYEVSAGIACGVAISFTPFVGFHLFLAGLTAWILRASVVASAIGTIFGNPWTFPLIWILVLYTGRYFLNVEGESAKVNFLQVFDNAFQAIINWDFSTLDKDIWPIIHPMLIGCIPYYIVSWIVTFVLVKRILDKFEARQQKREALLKE